MFIYIFHVYILLRVYILYYAILYHTILYHTIHLYHIGYLPLGKSYSCSIYGTSPHRSYIHTCTYVEIVYKQRYSSTYTQW